MTNGYVQAWTLDRSPMMIVTAFVAASRVTAGPGDEISNNFDCGDAVM